MSLDANDRPHGLHHFPSGEIHQGLLHRRNQIHHLQMLPHLLLIKKNRLIEFHWSILTTNSHEWTRIWFFH